MMDNCTVTTKCQQCPFLSICTTHKDAMKTSDRGTSVYKDTVHEAFWLPDIQSYLLMDNRRGKPVVMVHGPIESSCILLPAIHVKTSHPDSPEKFMAQVASMPHRAMGALVAGWVMADVNSIVVVLTHSDHPFENMQMVMNATYSATETLRTLVDRGLDVTPLTWANAYVRRNIDEARQEVGLPPMSPQPLHIRLSEN